MKYQGTAKKAESETGGHSDPKGVPKGGMSKAEHAAMHKPNHEFGADRGGTDVHECHRGKS